MQLSAIAAIEGAPRAVVVGDELFGALGGLVDEATARGHLADARVELAQLDRWRERPIADQSPNRLRALTAWRETHARDGGTLASLIDALDAAPVETWSMPPPRTASADPVEHDDDEEDDETLHALPGRRIGLFPVRAGHEVLAWLGFGTFNSCPPTPAHVARAMRWERDHAATLVYVSHDSYAFHIGRPPATDTVSRDPASAGTSAVCSAGSPSTPDQARHAAGGRLPPQSQDRITKQLSTSPQSLSRSAHRSDPMSCSPAAMTTWLSSAPTAASRVPCNRS